ncbi:MAG: efflux RND transporter permease subunit [Nannocystaceae bacterium]|nr:efflux RND transporter permease subunit [Nannocystaceae bacterium]
MIKQALERPYIVLVIVLVVAVLGSISAKKLAADLLPTYDTPAVQIVTFYPGMPPEVMERDIMSRLERWTGQSVGIEHQEARAMLGVSIVKDFFREGISLDTAMSQTTSYAVSDMFYLPPGTIPPMLMPFDPTASVPLCLVTVSSDTMSEKELYDVAYFELRNRLQAISGVIAPAVYGGKLRRILAYVDPLKLAARGLSPMDVVVALGKQSVFVPAGNMKAGDTDYQIFANAMPKKVEDLDDIPIAVRDGKTIYLRDVAKARDAAQIQSNIVRINGRRQVYIPIYRQPGANTIEIVDAIRSRLVRIGDRLREMDARASDLVLEINLDQSVYVRDSLEGLQLAGLLGAVFAGLIVAVFLRSIRGTIAVVLSIPIAVLAALAGLFYAGQTLNAMTLGGLALAVGILVDQSIVVLENIVRHRRLGKSPMAASLDGTREVAGPIFVSTLTFVVVFYPVVFLSGMARFLFTPLAIAATLSIFASLLVALAVIPAFCAKFLRVRPDVTEADARPGPLTRLYGALVRAAVRMRFLVVAGAVVGCALALYASRDAGTELFPRVDSGQFQIQARLRSGTRIETTEKVIAAIEAELIDELGQPDSTYPSDERFADSNLRMVISNIGVLMDWPAAYTPNAGPMDAFILVQLKGKDWAPGVEVTVASLRARLSDRFPEVEFLFNTGGMLSAALNFGEPAPIHFQVMGSDLQTLGELARKVARSVSGVPGAVDVRVAQRVDYPTIEVEIDRDKAALAGVTVEDVMHNLVTATNSSINFRPAFWIDERNGNHYFIGAQYAEHDMVDLDTLRDIPLVTPEGKSFPLRTVATIGRGTGPSVVSHYNITRVFDIYANVGLGHDVGSIVSAMESRLTADAVLGLQADEVDDGAATWTIAGEDYAGRGYTLRATGEVQTMRRSFEQFSVGLGVAAILVYLVMVAQFRSFWDPLLIMLAAPLGLVGVAGVVLLTDTTLNIQSFMGVIMMVGIVVEYGIILVDFANRGLAEGKTPTEAVIEAATVRLRPIMMTSLTTIFALLPMAIGIGAGDANVPLARTILGGVAAATVLTLIVLPCLYVITKRAEPAAKLEEST